LCLRPVNDDHGVLHVTLLVLGEEILLNFDP
jgi:hypothetical protein